MNTKQKYIPHVDEIGTELVPHIEPVPYKPSFCDAMANRLYTTPPRPTHKRL